MPDQTVFLNLQTNLNFSSSGHNFYNLPSVLTTYLKLVLNIQ